MLNQIEEGAQWPSAMRHARVAYMIKDVSADVANELEHRGLLMMAALYRRWEAYRLETATPWVDTWRIDALFGGLQGRSADEASWMTALEIEDAVLH